MTNATRDAKRHARTVASQGNAEMIYNILRQERSPRDAAATLAAVHACLIWDIEQANEVRARTIANEMVEGIVTLWRANKDAVDEQNRKAMQ